MTFLAAGLAGTELAGTALASGSGNSTSSINDITPGLLGFLVVAALGLALVFLLRSMNRQFRKLGPKPEETGPSAADEAELDAAGAVADEAKADGAMVTGAKAGNAKRP